MVCQSQSEHVLTQTKPRPSQEQPRRPRQAHGPTISTPAHSRVPGGSQQAANAFGRCSACSHAPPARTRRQPQPGCQRPSQFTPTQAPRGAAPSPAPFNTQPTAVRSLFPPLQSGRLCLRSLGRGFALPHRACARQWGGGGADMPGWGSGCGRRGAILARPIEKMAPFTAPPPPQGSEVSPRTWRPRRWGWAGGRRPLAGTFQGLVHPPDAAVELQHPQRRHFPAAGARPGTPGGPPERRPPVPPLFRSYLPALLLPPHGQQLRAEPRLLRSPEAAA